MLLIKQKDIIKYDGWIKEMSSQILHRFENDSVGLFPCNFARKAFNSDMVIFLPITYDNSLQSYNYNLLADGLNSYLEDSKEWNGKFNTAFPLLAIFEPNNNLKELKYCEHVFLNAIDYLRNNDGQMWPDHIPSSAKDKFWSMCFNGVEIFINISHPHHTLRKSRNLCDTLVFVINPRERFDKLGESSIRETIRKNINNYDEIPYSPLLGHYLKGELEWPQYMLPINNDSEPMECPFIFNEKKK